MRSTIGISAVGAALEGDRDVAAVVGEACEVARDIIAADHVEHHRDALALGQPLDRLDEIGGPVVDRMGRAELDRGGAFLVRCRR